MELRRHSGNQGRRSSSASDQLFQHLIEGQENILGRGCGRGPGSGNSDRGLGMVSTQREGNEMESKNRRLLINLKDGTSLRCPASMVHHICRAGDDSWVKTHDGVQHAISDMEAERLLERMFES